MIPEYAKTALAQALEMLPSNMDSYQARAQLLAIGLQESRLTARVQVLNGGGRGAARGLLQFEKGGGIKGVMTHPNTQKHAQRVCELRNIDPDSPAAIQHVWDRMEFDDVLTFGFGRLLLWADPKPLPPIGNAQAAWDCYVSAWRPGKPHRQTWDAFYKAAILAADRRITPR